MNNTLFDLMPEGGGEISPQGRDGEGAVRDGEGAVRDESEESGGLTVAKYLHLVNETLGLIPSDRMKVVGEIVDYRVSQGKWINFDLKDEEEDAKISCFATTFKVKGQFESGMKVEVMGYPKVYERFGKFSLNVQSLELVGEGALHKAYLMLKAQLEKEGLFDVGRKRGLKRFPRRIGLITSREAAAYGDFMRILGNRWGGVEVVHAHVHVQGQHAVNDILKAFDDFNSVSDREDAPDVIVLTRGGGSLEDLHAFNDEAVARAVYGSKIPVVVGVGHERDESLCDFVADVRASTPSNAAERIVPDRREVLGEVDTSVRRMGGQMMMAVERRKRGIVQASNVFVRFVQGQVYRLKSVLQRLHHRFGAFQEELALYRVDMERMDHTMERGLTGVVRQYKERVGALERFLGQVDVQRVLKRGFSIVRQGERVVTRADGVAGGDVVDVQLAHGKIQAEVK